MDAKLKALKVIDLKQILAKANISVPAKATKADLISRIQASKPALDAYASIYPQDDLLAPPEEVDWNVDQLDSPTTQPQKPKANAQPAAVPPAAPVPVPETASETASESTPAPATTQTETTEAAPVDDELEKRRQRAARFGIPLVEPKQKKPKAAPAPAATEKPTPSVAAAADPKKLEQRAARFGLKPPTPTTPAPTNGKKRASPQTQEVDAEEQERRKKRAERFGTANKA